MSAEHAIIQGEGFAIPYEHWDELHRFFTRIGYCLEEEYDSPDELGYWLEVNYPEVKYAMVGNEWNGKNMAFLILAASTYKYLRVEDLEGGLFAQEGPTEVTQREYHALWEIYTNMYPTKIDPAGSSNQRLTGVRVY